MTYNPTPMPPGMDNGPYHGGGIPMWQAKTLDDLRREVETSRENDHLWRIASIEQQLQEVWKALHQIEGLPTADDAAGHVEDALESLKDAFSWMRETHQRQNDEQMANMANAISRWGTPVGQMAGNLPPTYDVRAP